MGKEWADARRQANVERLGATLAAALDGQTSLTFELGCGHGHWLAAYAAAHPDEFCVGIDLITHRVERSVRKQTLGKLDNVLFLKAEATEFLDALPATVALRKIFILYPDPRLHFRTDDADYHAWTRDHLAAHPAWRLAADVPWPFERTTFFEERMQDKRDLVADRA